MKNFFDNSIDNLAPIGLTVYARLSHLEKTVQALKKNTLAGNSTLYIFSDGPKPGDVEKVQQVRTYIKSIEGFKKIVIVERKENSRINNNRGGQQFLLGKYGKMIWLAEDIQVAPGFLQFMNDALNYYESHENVISITGYCPPIGISELYPEDSFVLRRFNAWSFGTWKKKFADVETNLDGEQVRKNLNNPEFLDHLMSNGLDIPKMVLKEIRGEIDALDVKVMYQQVLKGWLTLYPKKSLVQNTGCDGSGIHCGTSDKFLHDKLWGKTKNFKFSDSVAPRPQIVEANYKFRFEINEFSKKKIVKDVIAQIKDRKINSLSLWGANSISALLIPNFLAHKFKINFIVDKKSEAGEFVFDGIHVVPIAKALNKGEKNFILCSTNHIDSMREALRQATGDRFEQINLVEIV